ncbi:MAG TPA: serine hydrolase [Pseudonocardiaceae bacterium]
MRTRRARWVLSASTVGGLLCLAATLTGCTPPWSTPAPTNVAAAVTNPPASSMISAVPSLADAVTTAVAAVPDGRIGIAVYDRQRGGMIGSYDADQSFATESVVKVLIGLDTLTRGGSAAQVSEMISRSDDATATSLWEAGGDNAILTRMIAKIGLTQTVPPANRGRWGDTTITANDLVTLYRYLLDQAPADERDIILAAMHGATNHGADGFDQYFGIPYAVGAGRAWAVKQGWACCKPDRVLNTTGLLDNDNRYILIVLTSHDASTGYPQDSDEITAAVRALLPALPQ